MLDIIAMVALCLGIALLIGITIKKKLGCALFYRCHHHDPEHAQTTPQPLCFVVDVDDSSPQRSTVIRIYHHNPTPQTNNPITSFEPVLSQPEAATTSLTTTTTASIVQASPTTASPKRAATPTASSAQATQEPKVRRSFLSMW